MSYRIRPNRRGEGTRAGRADASGGSPPPVRMACPGGPRWPPSARGGFWVGSVCAGTGGGHRAGPASTAGRRQEIRPPAGDAVQLRLQTCDGWLRSVGCQQLRLLVGPPRRVRSPSILPATDRAVDSSGGVPDITSAAQVLPHEYHFCLASRQFCRRSSSADDEGHASRRRLQHPICTPIGRGLMSQIGKGRRGRRSWTTASSPPALSFLDETQQLLGSCANCPKPIAERRRGGLELCTLTASDIITAKTERGGGGGAY